MVEYDEGSRTLVENIARREYGSDWRSAVPSVDARGLHADTNRVVVAKVNSYTALELLGEQATSAFGFDVNGNLIDSESHVAGKPDGQWTIVRTWWFEINNADRGDPGLYPGATPKGVKLRFVYSETRKV